MGECVFTGRGGKPKKLPILDANYPTDIDMTFIQGNVAKATFEARISEDGNPASYTYQWYVDNKVVEGANASSYVWEGTEDASHNIYCEVTNKKGTVKTRTASLKVEKYYLPTLNTTNPADATVEYNGSHTFSVGISAHGNPASYTYQWYVDGSAKSGATGTSFTASGLGSGNHSVYCKVTNAAGSINSRTATLTIGAALPDYTFSGSGHWLNDDGNGNWRLFFPASGTLRFTNRGTGINGIDIFLVGGGAGGRSVINNGFGGGGGGGGYTKTVRNIGIATNTDYSIVVGAGGGNSANGGETWFVGHGVGGGTTGGDGDRWMNSGGNGGSGGGGGSSWDGGRTPGNGGSDGSNGGKGNYQVGYGQGSTTREFGEAGATLYSGGGGGGACGSLAGANSWAEGTGGAGGGGNAQSPATFYGGGGGGGNYRNSTWNAGAAGWGGIVVIRNKR